MPKIIINCGESMLKSHNRELHPVDIFKRCKHVVDSVKNRTTLTYETDSNNPDFIQTMYHMCKKNDIKIKFTLDGIDVGDNIEIIFEDLNRIYDLLKDYEQNN